MKPQEYCLVVIIPYIRKNIDYIVTESPFLVSSHIEQVDQFLYYLHDKYDCKSIKDLKKFFAKEDLYAIYQKMELDASYKPYWTILNVKENPT